MAYYMAYATCAGISVLSATTEIVTNAVRKYAPTEDQIARARASFKNGRIAQIETAIKDRETELERLNQRIKESRCKQWEVRLKQ